ncbi:MAG: hypothetical protein M0P13_12590 [Fibrobacteraceae bacterium]|nr:hypothetical protein [Fibrobacteraceae bacterium]
MEWNTLYHFVYNDQGLTSNTVGTYLKASTDWTAYTNIPTGIDAYGFSALPAGNRNNYYSDFGVAGNYAFFWSATGSDSADADERYLGYVYESFYNIWNDKDYGFSVRCLQD